MPSDLSNLVSVVGTQIAFGSTLGFLIGYGVKKISALFLKLTAFVSGMFLLVLAYLNSTGIVSINFNALEQAVEKAFTGTISTLAASFVFLGQILPLGSSFTLGFYVGARKG